MLNTLVLRSFTQLLLLLQTFIYHNLFSFFFCFCLLGYSCIVNGVLDGVGFWQVKKDNLIWLLNLWAARLCFSVNFLLAKRVNELLPGNLINSLFFPRCLKVHQALFQLTQIFILLLGLLILVFRVVLLRIEVYVDTFKFVDGVSALKNRQMLHRLIVHVLAPDYLEL